MTEQYREQHKRRLAYMPWLYYSLNEKHRRWAQAWQQALQHDLCQMETVHFGTNCFLAPDAQLFAEPGRAIEVGDGTSIAAGCYLHGPISTGKNVSINQGCRLEGGRAGISIGDNSRIAAGCHLFAFNHGMAPDRLIQAQPVTSGGIRIGCDVWIGAACGITDGVTIGDHAVIGMNSTVTRDVAPYAIMAGSPARQIGDRRQKS